MTEKQQDLRGSVGFPRWLSGKESTCQCRRLGFDPESGRSPGGGNGKPLQYSCLENSVSRGSLVGYSCKESDVIEHGHKTTHEGRRRMERF